MRDVVAWDHDQGSSPGLGGAAHVASADRRNATARSTQKAAGRHEGAAERPARDTLRIETRETQKAV